MPGNREPAIPVPCASVRRGGFSELVSSEAVRVTLSRDSAMRGEVDCDQKLSKVNDKI